MRFLSNSSSSCRRDETKSRSLRLLSSGVSPGSKSLFRLGTGSLRDRLHHTLTANCFSNRSWFKYSLNLCKSNLLLFNLFPRPRRLPPARQLLTVFDCLHRFEKETLNGLCNFGKTPGRDFDSGFLHKGLPHRSLVRSFVIDTIGKQRS